MELTSEGMWSWAFLCWELFLFHIQLSFLLLVSDLLFLRFKIPISILVTLCIFRNYLVFFFCFFKLLDLLEYNCFLTVYYHTIYFHSCLMCFLFISHFDFWDFSPLFLVNVVKILIFFGNLDINFNVILLFIAVFSLFLIFLCYFLPLLNFS